MRIDLEATRKVVAKALDLGITLFDTADIYGNMGGSETMLGQVLNERRKDLVLEATRKVVAKALDLGITLFDTADIYGNMGGSETMLGQVLNERRKDIVLATKFAGPMTEGARRN